MRIIYAKRGGKRTFVQDFVFLGVGKRVKQGFGANLRYTQFRTLTGISLRPGHLVRLKVGKA